MMKTTLRRVLLLTIAAASMLLVGFGNNDGPVEFIHDYGEVGVTFLNFNDVVIAPQSFTPLDERDGATLGALYIASSESALDASTIGPDDREILTRLYIAPREAWVTDGVLEPTELYEATLALHLDAYPALTITSTEGVANSDGDARGIYARGELDGVGAAYYAWIDGDYVWYGLAIGDIEFYNEIRIDLMPSAALPAIATPQQAALENPDGVNLLINLPDGFVSVADVDNGDLNFAADDETLTRLDTINDPNQRYGTGGQFTYFDNAVLNAVFEGDTPTAQGLFDLIAGSAEGFEFGEPTDFVPSGFNSGLIADLTYGANEGEIVLLVNDNGGVLMTGFSIDGNVVLRTIAASVQLTTDSIEAVAVVGTGDPVSIPTLSGGAMTITYPNSWVVRTNPEASAISGATSETLLDRMDNEFTAEINAAPANGDYLQVLYFESDILPLLAPDNPNAVGVYQFLTDGTSTDYAEPTTFAVEGFPDTLKATFATSFNTGAIYVLVNDNGAVIAFAATDSDLEAVEDVLRTVRLTAEGELSTDGATDAPPVVEATPEPPFDPTSLTQTATIDIGNDTVMTLNLPDGWLFSVNDDENSISYRSSADANELSESLPLSAVGTVAWGGVSGEPVLLDRALLDVLLAGTDGTADALLVLLTQDLELAFGETEPFIPDGFTSGVRMPFTAGQNRGAFYVFVGDNGAVLNIAISDEGLAATDAMMQSVRVTGPGVASTPTDNSGDVDVTTVDVDLTQTAEFIAVGTRMTVGLPDGWAFETDADQFNIRFASNSSTLNIYRSTALENAGNVNWGGTAGEVVLLDNATLDLLFPDTAPTPSGVFNLLAGGLPFLSFGATTNFDTPEFDSGIRTTFTVGDTVGAIYVMVNDNGAVLGFIVSNGDISVGDAVIRSVTLSAAD